jgi:hypothetical protein
MTSPASNNPADINFHEAESVVSCFFNSIFGHTRNWPRAYACLSPGAREKFESMQGLASFADYWEDKLSFLEELVHDRHKEYPYTHRTCFSLDQVEASELADTYCVFEVRLIENHVAAESMLIVQTKTTEQHEGKWLLANGELEGKLDDIIIVKSRRKRRR